MGYHTEFKGSFEITGKMDRAFVEYINRFSGTRRMKRDNNLIKECYPNWEELCFDGQLGEEGEYLAIVSNCFGQESNDSIVDYNCSAKSQPGLWCKWIINVNENWKDNNISEFTGRLEWNGGEKFYDYIEWLAYMINRFFKRKGLELNGVVLAVGEEPGDATYIVVDHNGINYYNAIEEDGRDDVVEWIKFAHEENEYVLRDLAEVAVDPGELYEIYWPYCDDYDDNDRYY